MRKTPDPTDRYVGSRVRMRRMMLGMSQTELAQAVGVTFQQVQKYEKGTNRVSASRLQQMSHVMGVPIPFFFDGSLGRSTPSKATATASDPSYISEFLATKDGLSLVKAFMRIKDRNIRLPIVRLVEQIAGLEK